MSTVTLLWSLTLAFGLLALWLLQRRTSTPYLVIVLISALFLTILADSLIRRGERRRTAMSVPDENPDIPAAEMGVLLRGTWTGEQRGTWRQGRTRKRIA